MWLGCLGHRAGHVGQDVRLPVDGACQNPRPGKACSTAMLSKNTPSPARTRRPSRGLCQVRSGSAISAPGRGRRRTRESDQGAPGQVALSQRTLDLRLGGCRSGARPGGPKEMAAPVVHGVMEAQHTDVDVPLPCRLALVLQVTAVPPDPGCGLGEFGGRLLPFVLWFGGHDRRPGQRPRRSGAPGSMPGLLFLPALPAGAPGAMAAIRSPRSGTAPLPRHTPRPPFRCAGTLLRQAGRRRRGSWLAASSSGSTRRSTVLSTSVGSHAIPSSFSSRWASADLPTRGGPPTR